MRSMEFSGKSIDEAVFIGLNEMGVSLDAVNIEVVQHETKGVFGIGAKPAVVRLTEKPLEDILAESEILSQQEANHAKPRERRNDRPNRDHSPVSGERREPREGRPVRESRGQRENRLAREAATNAQSPAEAPKPAREPKPEINYSKELAEQTPAAEFLKGLLEHMGVEATVLAAEYNGGLRLRIDSASMGILIGHRGETLDAMQYLTSLVINRTRKENGYIRVTLDTEDYRDKREETLQRLARRLASQVKSSGRSRTLEPMNPYERRILHSALQNNPYVTTHSEGEEPNRRVVISPKK